MKNKGNCMKFQDFVFAAVLLTVGVIIEAKSKSLSSSTESPTRSSSTITTKPTQFVSSLQNYTKKEKSYSSSSVISKASQPFTAEFINNNGQVISSMKVTPLTSIPIPSSTFTVNINVHDKMQTWFPIYNLPKTKQPLSLLVTNSNNAWNIQTLAAKIYENHHTPRKIPQGTLTNLCEQCNTFTINSYYDQNFKKLYKSQILTLNSTINLPYKEAPYTKVLYADGKLMTTAYVNETANVITTYCAFMALNPETIGIGISNKNGDLQPCTNNSECSSGICTKYGFCKFLTPGTVQNTIEDKITTTQQNKTDFQSKKANDTSQNQ
jgi:hypothetical protein